MTAKFYLNLVFIFIMVALSSCSPTKRITTILEGEKITVPKPPPQQKKGPPAAKISRDSVKEKYTPIPSPPPVITQRKEPSPVFRKTKKPVITEHSIPIHIIEERLVPVYRQVQDPQVCESEQVDMQFIQSRIEAYEEKKNQWNIHAGQFITLDMGGTWPDGWHDCVQNIEIIVFGYRRIQEANLFPPADSPQAKGEQPDLWLLLNKDLQYAESGCDDLFTASRSKINTALESFSHAARSKDSTHLRQYIDNGQYLLAAESYNKLPGLLKTTETMNLYSIALRRLGQYKNAAGILHEIITNTNFSQLPIKQSLTLQMDYADLLFAAGELHKAKEAYHKLEDFFFSLQEKTDWASNQAKILSSDNKQAIDDYGNLMKAYTSFDGKQITPSITKSFELIDQTQEGVLLTGAQKILQQTENQSAEWARHQLSLVDGLIHDQDLEKADLLVNQLLTGAPEPIQLYLQEAKEDIKNAKIQEDKNRLALQEQSQKNLWNNAIKLLEQKKYDSAMAAFADLINTEYDTEARTKMAAAANLAATQMRRKAAALFVKAKKTFNPEKKKSLLLESKSLLFQLLEQYPSFNLLDKVKQNLLVLEEELKTLQPNFDAPTSENGTFEEAINDQ